jgi:hypothetical protein
LEERGTLEKEERCKLCKKIMKKEDIIKTDFKYHKGCHCCTLCKKEREEDFTIVNNKFYCPEQYFLN